MPNDRRPFATTDTDTLKRWAMEAWREFLNGDPYTRWFNYDAHVLIEGELRSKEVPPT